MDTLSMPYKGNVDVCPITKETWEERAKAKSEDCGGQSVYHCLADKEDRKWERCEGKSLIKEGFCPIFTNKGFIDWKPCNKSISTCPNISYFSDEVYKYPHCFGNNTLQYEMGVINNKANDVAKIIGAVFGLVVFVAAILTFTCLYMRRKRLNSKQNDDNEESQLLPPGRLKDTIVFENSILRGITLLWRDEVRSIVIVGKFGNSVSSTSRWISEKFKVIMNWNSHECRYTEIPQTVDENTIMFVYGWFGLWNDDLCSLDKVKKACQSLIRILKETKNVKLILGMRSDLNRKYHQELDAVVYSQDTSLVQYEINLDGGVDICKDCEYCQLLNDQIIKPCEKSDCACKCLKYEMLRKGTDGVVGMPLKIRIIQKYHELIPNYVDNSDMLKVTKYHFATLEKDREKRYVYEWITYICFKGKFSRSDPFDTHLVEEMDFGIKQSSFNENDTELSRYVRMRNSDKLRNESSENAEYVFWHPFIYICAFHFLFYKDPEFFMKYCNVDAILQLVRPRGYKTSYFEVAANDKCVTLFNERIRQLGREKEFANNPLVAKGTGTEEAETLQIQLCMDHGS